ncbi:MAG TPA: PepSY-associated TM helix domain-containing protein [Allosphingosinicella sp.]|nr:PepSY-associated TM helix domain-containing protein [Allosphingosinicella sp.]
MANEVEKTYKDVHTWVGIVSGLFLFIAFYAGSITMFEEPLQRWATPPSAVQAPSLAETSRLLDATLAAHPEARRDYQVHLEPQPGATARVTWTVRPEVRVRGAEIRTYVSSFGPDGRLQVQRLEQSGLAELIDMIHQRVGLPLSDAWARPLMGIVCLLYAIAIISGLIVLLPSLIKDLFILRVGKNLKRMWLDVHNVLGVFSLPFHIVMALTGIVFAFHDQVYFTQNYVVYENRLESLWGEEEHEPQGNRVALPPERIVQLMAEQAPGFRVTRLNYQTDRAGALDLHVWGEDPRYQHRSPTRGFAGVDPYTGEIVERDYLPGQQPGWMSSVSSFFALHFGNYGGPPVRWLYFLLGLAGAFIFYSGNLLWIESRRKKERKAGAVVQSRSTRLMGSLTVGVSLGCIVGISLTTAAAKWLPAITANVAVWHWWIYYVAFFACAAWAFLRGAARSSVELLWACAITTFLIPASSFLAWRHETSESALVDAVAMAGVIAFALMARRTARRLREGRRDSIWAGPEAPAPQAG